MSRNGASKRAAAAAQKSAVAATSLARISSAKRRLCQHCSRSRGQSGPSKAFDGFRCFAVRPLPLAPLYFANIRQIANIIIIIERIRTRRRSDGRRRGLGRSCFASRKPSYLSLMMSPSRSRLQSQIAARREEFRVFSRKPFCRQHRPICYTSPVAQFILSTNCSHFVP